MSVIRDAVAVLVVALAFNAASSTNATALSLGYGDFRGEFSGNYTPNGDAIEVALGLDGELTWIGSSETGSPGKVEFTFTEFKSPDGRGEPIGGIWENVSGDALGWMLLAVKYSSFFSVFEYDFVGADDTGLFASDPALTGADMSTNPNGQPFAISHVDAFIPLPGALLLFVSAVAGLAGIARLRSA